MLCPKFAICNLIWWCLPVNKLILTKELLLTTSKVSNDKKHNYDNIPEIKAEIEKLEKEFSGNGRILIRPSGTEPLVRVMIEGEDTDYITTKAKNLAKLIEKNLN